MKRWIVGDFETASSINLKHSGGWRYSEDVDTEVLCFAYGNAEWKKVWIPSVTRAELEAVAPSVITDPAACKRFLDAVVLDLKEVCTLAADPDVIWIAHNAAFEKAHWRNQMYIYQVPPIPNNRWHDTMATAAHYALPQELEKLAAVLGLKSQKDMEGRKVTLGMSKPDKRGYYDRSIAKRIRAAAYCLSDIDTEVAAHQCLGWLPSSERNIWLLNQRTNERGLRLDMEFVRAAQKIVDDASQPLLAEFTKLTGGLKLQSPKLLGWLKTRGVNIPNLQKETVAEYIGDDEVIEDDDLPDEPQLTLELHKDAHRALRIRQLIGSASVKKLKRMETCVSLDGRARGLSQYHGTAPGRAAGRLFQPYNFPRGTVKIDGKAPKPEVMVAAIKTGDYKHVERVCGTGAVESVVSSLRHAIIPDPDRVFLSGDYAGIQARVVLAVAGQTDKLGLFSDDRLGKEGADIYLDMAAQIYKRPMTKDDKAERQIGKNSVLGLGFQMGWKKFRFKYAKDQSEEFCKQIVDTYRKEWAPEVPNVWWGLSRAAVQCVHTGLPEEVYGVEYRMEGNALSARLPSGRKIWYQSPKATLEPMPWDETDLRKSFRYHVMKMGQWKEVKAFGGLLTENVVMGIEVDIQRAAQLKCEKNGFPVVLEVYDEIVVEPKKEDADENAFKQILLDVDPWVKALQIPIATEIWKGDRYRK